MYISRWICRWMGVCVRRGRSIDTFRQVGRWVGSVDEEERSEGSIVTFRY